MSLSLHEKNPVRAYDRLAARRSGRARKCYALIPDERGGAEPPFSDRSADAPEPKGVGVYLIPSRFARPQSVAITIFLTRKVRSAQLEH